MRSRVDHFGPRPHTHVIGGGQLRDRPPPFGGSMRSPAASAFAGQRVLFFYFLIIGPNGQQSLNVLVFEHPHVVLLSVFSNGKELLVLRILQYSDRVPKRQ